MTAASADSTLAPKQQPAMVAWAVRNQKVATGIAAIFILLYVSPVILAAIGVIRSGFFQEPNDLLVWFAAFIKSSDSTLGGVHKVLFPFLVTLSLIAFKDKLNFWVLGLGLFVLVMFVLTVWIGVLFDVGRYQTAIANQTSSSLDIGSARAFFVKMQDMLLMYIALLLGLSATNEKH